MDQFLEGLLSKKNKKAKQLSVYESSGPLASNHLRFLLSLKRLGVFLLPPGWDASPSQGYAQHLIPFIRLVW